MIKKITMFEFVGSRGGIDSMNRALHEIINSKPNLDMTLFTSGYNELKADKIKIEFEGIFEKNKIYAITKFLLKFYKCLIFSKKNNVEIIHFHIYSFGIFEFHNIFISKYFFNFKVVSTIHDIESLDKIDHNKLSFFFVKTVRMLDKIIFRILMNIFRTQQFFCTKIFILFMLVINLFRFCFNFYI